MILGRIASLMNRCPPLRWIRTFLLWIRGGAEKAEAWQGDSFFLRRITYDRFAADEVAWSQTGQTWVEQWILPSIAKLTDANWRVLEIGCGPGRLLAPLAERFREVIGVDFSQDMINYATRRLSAFTNIILQKNDGATLPFQDQSVDLVLSVIAFQHMSLVAIRSYFSETFRVLKPSGLFRFQTRRDIQRRNVSIYDRHFLSKDEVLQLAKTIGFELLSYESGLGHPSWHWFTFQKPGDS
jgi:ubiquinone/menaquinone biosynthesis C-methylase UbiE